jgi:hypothetical protein
VALLRVRARHWKLKAGRPESLAGPWCRRSATSSPTSTPGSIACPTCASGRPAPTTSASSPGSGLPPDSPRSGLQSSGILRASVRPTECNLARDIGRSGHIDVLSTDTVAERT